MRRRSLALVAGGLLVLAGCGDTPGYDAAAVESYLVTSQADTFGATGVDSASCPADRELAEGMQLTCTLKVSGAKLPYRVTLRNVHEPKVTVTAHPDGVLVSGAKLSSFVRSTLPKDAKGADVSCGGPFLVARVGTKVDCALVLGSQEKPLTVTVLDKAGRVSIGS
jgi:hypothetical protein